MKYKNIITRLKTQIPDAIPHPSFHQHWSPTLILFLASCCFSPQLDPSTCHDKIPLLVLGYVCFREWNQNLCMQSKKNQKTQVKLTFFFFFMVEF